MTAAPRKRPWELHAILCLFLIALGVANAMGKLQSGVPETEFLVALGGVTFSLIGLFRGSLVAWYASAFAFAILTVGSIYLTLELILQYGFVAHRMFAEAYVATGLCLGTFGLLLSLRLRKAFPPRAEPLVGDLPAFQAVLKILAPLVFLAAAAFSLATPVIFASRGYRGERNVSTSLKTLCSAEADFRANDRDWNYHTDFWTGDVQGLYGVTPVKGIPNPLGFGTSDPPGGYGPVKLIEMSVALADGHPLRDQYPPIDGEAGSKAGGWFAALRADRSAAPPETYGIRNPSRFGFIAYSDDYIGGLKYAFIVNENNTIFRQRVERNLLPGDKRPPGPPSDPAFRDWPGEDELKARWGKLD